MTLAEQMEAVRREVVACRDVLLDAVRTDWPILLGLYLTAIGFVLALWLAARSSS